MRPAYTKVMLAAAGLLIAAPLGTGWFSGAAQGLALCSAGMLGLLACWNVKARRKHQEARRNSSRSFFAQARPDNPAAVGAGVLDREYRVLWCNARSSAHLGIRAESDIGRPIDQIVQGSSFAAYLAAGEFSQPLRLAVAGQERTVLSVWLVPYLESQWLLLTVDITRDVEREITRRDRVADALHELSSPVTVLAGTVDAMRGFAFGPRRLRDSLDSMEEQCRRIQRTVEGLLSLSALESDPDSPRDERIALRKLTDAIRAEAEALSAGQHRIVLEAVAGLDLIGNGGEIASAFRNLACNAVRYTPPGGEIRLTWRALPAGGAEFAVEDNGIGIAREHIPRLTERFFRVDRGLSRKTAGTGLGLAIVKDALTRHQAALEIESEPGRGSRFTARFPAHRVVPATAVPPVIGAARRPTRSAPGMVPLHVANGRMAATELRSAPSRVYGRIFASMAGKPRRGR